MTDQRYLLCRPRGGLSDNLGVIERCFRYARRHRRTLVVDTRSAGGFYRQFSRSFEWSDRGGRRVLGAVDDALLDRLEELTTFPRSLQGRLSSYENSYDDRIDNFVEKESGERLSFDFKKDYCEELLVHEQCGGGRKSIHLLSRLRFTAELRRAVELQLAPLGDDRGYTALVVRHNYDYQTDYETFFAQHVPSTCGRTVLVCSDNAEVLAAARRAFSESKFVTLSETPDSGGVPLARYIADVDGAARDALHVKALSDLLGLARARHLHTAQLTNLDGKCRPLRSGFTRLAEDLHRSGWVVDGLMAQRGRGALLSMASSLRRFTLSPSQRLGRVKEVQSRTPC